MKPSIYSLTRNDEWAEAQGEREIPRHPDLGGHRVAGPALEEMTTFQVT